MTDELLKELIKIQKENNRLLTEIVYNNLPPDALLTREMVAVKFGCKPDSVGRTKETRYLTPVKQSGKHFYYKQAVDAVLKNLKRDAAREAARLLRNL